MTWHCLEADVTPITPTPEPPPAPEIPEAATWLPLAGGIPAAEVTLADRLGDLVVEVYLNYA